MTDKDKIFEQFITNTRKARNIKLVGRCKNWASVAILLLHTK